MTSRGSTKVKPKPKCYHCGRRGHIKRFCWDLNGEKEGQKKTSQKAAVTQENSDSTSEDSGLLIASPKVITLYVTGFSSNLMYKTRHGRVALTNVVLSSRKLSLYLRVRCQMKALE